MKNVKLEQHLSPDDPRLTAYALGELEGDERAAIEAAVSRDAAARGTVEAVRTMAGEMSAALAKEPAAIGLAKPASRSETLRRAAIVQGPDLRKLDGGAYRGTGKLIRFPQVYFIIPGLAAACFAMFVTMRDPAPVQAPRKQYREMALAPVAAPHASLDEAVLDKAPGTVATSVATVDTVETPLSSPMKTEDEGKFSLLAQVKDAKLKDDILANNGLRLPQTFQAEMPPVVGDRAAASVGLRLPATGGKESPVVRNITVQAEKKLAASALPAGSFGGQNYSTTSSNLAPWMTTLGRERLAGVGGINRAPLGEVRQSRALADLAAVLPLQGVAQHNEIYAAVADNDFLAVVQHPLSTFAVDVDTASYANVRRFLRSGTRPPRDAVRIEELVNYFPYRYAPPGADARGEGTAAPVAAYLEVAAAPWATGHRLVRIGLKGREVATSERGAANLVFLLDVSGSMNEPNKLPLVKASLRLLVDQLRPDDRVAIVTYAGNSGLALPSTPVAQAREILAALDSLTPGGSTNGGMGIELAYDIAKANFVNGGVNRVILCTDGDFNVGVTGEGDLTRLITEKAKSGVFLTALGFGMGNLKDATLEKLADKGNGTYGYIDSRREAEKLLVQQVNSTLITIAKDVKIQVDFNPARVASYRLIGYENRRLKQEDFNNDSVDAGEIGAGHTVTALYEIVPAGAEESAAVHLPRVDESKYAAVKALGAELAATASAELLTVRMRYKEPAGTESKKLEFPLIDTGMAFAAASADFKFAAAVAGFGMILRDSPYRGSATLAQVVEWAESGTVEDAGGWRSEFVGLARAADSL